MNRGAAMQPWHLDLLYFRCRLAPSRTVIAAEPSTDIGGRARDGEVVYARGLVKN